MKKIKSNSNLKEYTQVLKLPNKSMFKIYLKQVPAFRTGGKQTW